MPILNGFEACAQIFKFYESSNEIDQINSSKNALENRMSDKYLTELCNLIDNHTN